MNNINHLRIFIKRDGGHLSECNQLENWSSEFADILIVCGQGVYENGIYYGEFHDRDIYFEHALRFPKIARRFNYNLIVLSGGFTQKYVPWLSESESFIRILKDADKEKDLNSSIPCVLDECALDSSENLLLGLMTARLVLKNIPVRRVGIWAAFKFKKWRFNRNAQALGIVEQTYFHGFAPASETNIQVPPDDSKQKLLKEYENDMVEYSLLRTQDKEDKRRKRWQNNRTDKNREPSLAPVSELRNLSLWQRNTILHDAQQGTNIIMMYDNKLCSSYANRLDNFSDFANTWNSIRMIEQGTSVEESGLKDAFRKEIMKL